jgi:membrane-associated phospholipid phosphatase
VAATAVYFLCNFSKPTINLYVNGYVGSAIGNFFFYYITYLGDGRMAGVILLGILLYNVRLGLYSLFSFLNATIAATTLKYVYFDNEHRPFYFFQYIELHDVKYVDGVDLHIHNSFPSGHATQAFAILMCVAFSSSKQWVKLLCLLLAILTSFSRVYLSQHWLIDITAGSAIGLFFSIIYWKFFIYHNRFPKLNRSLKSLRSA